MKRHAFLVFSLLISGILGAQDLRHYDDFPYTKENNRADTLNHESVRDLYFFLARACGGDLRSPIGLGDRRSPVRAHVDDKLFHENLVIINRPGYLITADPLFDSELGRETVNNTYTWLNMRGVQMYGKIDLSKKVERVETVELVEEPLCPHAPMPLSPSFEFYTTYFESQARLPRFLDSLARNSGGVPGQGMQSNVNDIWDHSYATAWIRYRANKYFTFETGTGKNFFGNGYRSLLLSDNARNYPYFRIDTRLWRIHYTNLWAEFQDRDYTDGPLGPYQKKYGAFHYLSYSVTSKLEVSLFDAIIWQGRDSLHTRGFDVTYLNPVIFLRAAEWTLGSPDNALIGANINYKFTPDIQLYGQVIFDEFAISHMKAIDGYWANKYGGQIGLKSFIPIDLQSLFSHPGVKTLSFPRKREPLPPSGLFFQSEFNFVRPYTYSHWTSKRNYGHLRQPLAHPLGANFMEWVTFARLHHNRFILEGRYSWALYGANYHGLNFGHDIFEDYNTHVNELDNFIGQGQKTTLTYTSATISWLMNPVTFLNVFCTITNRHQFNEIRENNSLWLTFGVRNSIRNFYYDY
jgi:hypothetical protein